MFPVKQLADLPRRQGAVAPWNDHRRFLKGGTLSAIAPQVSQALRELASALESEGGIPVGQSDDPDFYIYGHQSGEPVVAGR
jgi:hypothetical protein